jgi:hypothetical protein
MSIKLHVHSVAYALHDKKTRNASYMEYDYSRIIKCDNTVMSRHVEGQGDLEAQ